MISTISTYAGILQRQTTTAQLQSGIGRLTTEASTGLLADPVTEMKSGITSFYQLQSTQAQQTAVQTAATAVGSRLDTMQTALTGIANVVSNIAATALTASGTSAGDKALDAVNSQATDAANQILGLLNTTHAGEYVFSGNDSGNAAVASSADGSGGLLDQASGLLSSAAGGGTLGTGGLAAFESSLGSLVGTAGSSGTVFGITDTSSVQVSIGGSQSMSYNMQANSKPFQDIMKGLAMLSLASDPSSPLDDDARQQMLTDATNTLNSGQSELTVSTGVLGAKQSQLQQVADTQQAAADATQAQVTTMDTADPYDTATRLSALQTQLQATYEITSMISKLSFVDYMS